ncbi:MAG TPA: hypothetical protein DGU45_05660 [Planctomycetes bacterium]|nr:hypothetical protein [Planctomycetota bacterium]
MSGSGDDLNLENLFITGTFSIFSPLDSSQNPNFLHVKVRIEMLSFPHHEKGASNESRTQISG